MFLRLIVVLGFCTLVGCSNDSEPTTDPHQTTQSPPSVANEGNSPVAHEPSSTAANRAGTVARAPEETSNGAAATTGDHPLAEAAPKDAANQANGANAPAPPSETSESIASASESAQDQLGNTLNNAADAPGAAPIAETASPLPTADQPGDPNNTGSEGASARNGVHQDGVTPELEEAAVAEPQSPLEAVLERTAVEEEATQATVTSPVNANAGTPPTETAAKETPPDTEEGANATGAEDDPAAPVAPAPYTVTLRQSEVDTVLEVRPREAKLPRLAYWPDSRALSLELDEQRPASEQVDDLSGMLRQLGQELQAAVLPSAVAMRAEYTVYPEYAARLARHASHDPEWKAVRRKSAKQGLSWADAANLYVGQLAPEESLHPELDQAFAALGLTLQIAEVTDCTVLKPGHSWLRKQGISSSQPLPAGCATGFKVGQAKPTEGEPTAANGPAM